MSMKRSKGELFERTAKKIPLRYAFAVSVSVAAISKPRYPVATSLDTRSVIIITVRLRARRIYTVHKA